MSVRVVLADDHPMFRFGLEAVLAQSDAVEVLATASSGAELVHAVRDHRPDVVITDLSMPDLDGVAATRQLLEMQPDLGVLVLTMHEDDEHLFAALRAGARGYLVKGAEADEIVRAVLAVAEGGAVYGASVARRVVASHTQPPAPTAAFPDLTPRERDVLGLIAAGSRNHDIAAQLGMSEKTVRNHVSQVLLKLQVPDRTAAALKARDAGMNSN